MEKWEYKTLPLGCQSGEAQDYSEEFTELGREGWRLVHIVQGFQESPQAQFPAFMGVAVFERPHSSTDSTQD